MITVLIPFHAGDQNSAACLFENLLSVNDGVTGSVEYVLSFGDPVEKLSIWLSIARVISSRNARLVIDDAVAPIDEALIADDPNIVPDDHLHTIRDAATKARIYRWNRTVFKAIQDHDLFLVCEPDCILLKHNWLYDIVDAYDAAPTPIFGHLKQGLIAGKPTSTHFAGCSVYDGKALRDLPLEALFHSRYDNPWWPLRLLPGSTAANNCFWGPAYSGYDVSYDYLLYSLYQRERHGHNDPLRWEQRPFVSRDDLILCDFRSQKTIGGLFDRFLDKQPLIHGVKDDAARMAAARYFRSGRQRQYSKPPQSDDGLPLSGPLRPSFDWSRSLREQQYAPIDRLRTNPTPRNETQFDLNLAEGAFAGETCFIIGNGPSLKSTDLTKLKDKYTFGLNRIYLNYENMGFEPTFYCCVNELVGKQFGHEVSNLKSIKFLSSAFRSSVRSEWNTYYMDSLNGLGFSKNIGGCFWHPGWTVTYCAIQVAFHLGFSCVVLVGVDHFFEVSGEANLAVVADRPDPNHFSPDYFGKGVKWQYPDLDRSEASYRIAKKKFEDVGRRIFDATIGGRLQIYEKVDFDVAAAASTEGLMSMSKKHGENGHANGQVVAKIKLPEPEQRGQPLVSVIMAAYNAADYIREAVASILDQSYKNIELVVANDGSTDDTAAILTQIAKDDARLRVLPFDTCRGVSAARNSALGEAKGEFVAFLDADDYLHVDSVEARVDALLANRRVNVVHGLCDMVNESGDLLGVLLGLQNKATFSHFYGNPFHLSAVMFRRSAAPDLRFPEERSNGEDWLFLGNLIRLAGDSDYINAARSFYRIHRKSAVMADFVAHELALGSVLAEFCEPPVGLSGPEAAKLVLDKEKAQLVAEQRGFGAVAWFAVSLDGDGLMDALGRLSAQAIAGGSAASIETAMKTSAIRTSGRTLSGLRLWALDNAQAIIDMLVEHQAARKYPRVIFPLLSLLGLDQFRDSAFGLVNRRNINFLDEGAVEWVATDKYGLVRGNDGETLTISRNASEYNASASVAIDIVPSVTYELEISLAEVKPRVHVTVNGVSSAEDEPKVITREFSDDKGRFALTFKCVDSMVASVVIDRLSLRML